jgi:hypothetical protein
MISKSVPKNFQIEISSKKKVLFIRWSSIEKIHPNIPSEWSEFQIDEINSAFKTATEFNVPNNIINNRIDSPHLTSTN